MPEELIGYLGPSDGQQRPFQPSMMVSITVMRSHGLLGARGVVACDQVQLHARVCLRDVAEEAWRGDCGTFVPCQAAVFQHSIEGKAPGQCGRQGTRPNDGTALMTVTPDLDLWPMFAGTPDQVPDRIKAQGTVGRLASLKSSSALGASWLRAGLLHNRQIWAVDDGLDM